MSGRRAPAPDEPKGRTLLLVGLACVIGTAWVEGAGPGTISALFAWVGLAVIALVSVSVTLLVVWVILVLAFSPKRNRRG